MLLASDHPQVPALRRWTCEILHEPGQRARHHAAWIEIEEQSLDENRAALESLAEQSGTAALLLGRVRETTEGMEGSDMERLMERWDAILGKQGSRSDLLWGLLPLYARVREARGELDEAHRWKLRESHLKVHDEKAWEDTVRLWKAAREQELAPVMEPQNVEEALRAARLLRLLLRPSEAISRLQSFRNAASGEVLGRLLCELGLSFGLENRYDLAARCHAEADDLLIDPEQQMENRFTWAVALSYLQESTLAREIFLSILTRDIDHAGARTELEKLNLPQGMLQLYQLVELTHTSWDGVLRLLKAEDAS
ncbi:MAG: hypothetical protein GY856_28165 [bacterium]|nr:hypothetical protein [bacterium]